MTSRRALVPMLLAAGALAGQPLLGGLHYLTTAHFYCPEHHTLAHVQGAPAGHEHDVPMAEARLAPPDDHRDLELDHEACATVLAERRLDEGPAPSIALAPRLARVERAAPRPGAPRAARRALDVAPKASPPSTDLRVA